MERPGLAQQSEQPTSADAAEANQPGEAPGDGGGEQQLDAMLSGLGGETAGEGSETAPPGPGGGDDEAGFEDDLARQIQELLDEAQEEVGEAASPTSAPDVDGAVAATTDAAATEQGEAPAAQPRYFESDDAASEPSDEPGPAEATSPADAPASGETAEGQTQAPGPGEAVEAAESAGSATATEAESSASDPKQAQGEAEGQEPSLDELDNMLATEADEAVVGAFESPGEVLETGPATEQADQASPSPDVAAAQKQGQADSAAGEATPNAQPVNATPLQTGAGPAETADPSDSAQPGEAEGQSAGGESATEADEEADMPPADAFASPDDVLKEGTEAATPVGGDATDGAAAGDVAAELDSQPEQAAPSAPASEPAPAGQTRQTSDTRATDETPGRDWRYWLKKTVALVRTGTVQAWSALRQVPVRRICATVNAPMQQLSPQVRHTIGYVGLLTLFNAVALLLAAMALG